MGTIIISWITAVKGAAIASAFFSKNLAQLKRAMLALQALTATSSAFAAATTLAFAAAGAAIIAYVIKMKQAADEASKSVHDAENALKQGDSKRAQDKSEIEELEMLRRKQAQQKLSSEEVLRAVEIVAKLKGKYGDVGYEVDAVTGKIKAAKGAQDKLNRAIAEQKVKELRAAIAEKEHNIHDGKLIRDMADEEVGAGELAIGKQRNTGKIFAKYSYFSGSEINPDGRAWGLQDDRDTKVWMLKKDTQFQKKYLEERQKQEKEIAQQKAELKALEDALKVPVEETSVSNITAADVEDGLNKTSAFIAEGVGEIEKTVEQKCVEIDEERDKLVSHLKGLVDPSGELDWNDAEAISTLEATDENAKKLIKQISDVNNSAENQKKDLRAKEASEWQGKEDAVKNKIADMEKQAREAKEDANDPDVKMRREIDRIHEQTEAYREQLQTLLDIEKAKEGGGDEKVVAEIEDKIKTSHIDEMLAEQDAIQAREDEKNQKLRDAMEDLVEKFGTPIEKLELAQKNLASATQALQEAQESGDKEQIAAALTRLGEAQTKYLDAQEATKAVDKSVKSLGGTFDAWQAVSLTRQASYEKKAYDESRTQTRYLAEISRKIGQAFFA